ncbi:hypothetical protein OAU13_01070 [bacterium]|nr:hypothetical protein [bacterium]
MKLFDDDYSHFTFTHRRNGKDVTINLDKQDATVTDLLDEFMSFMKACGYCFHIDDRLDVINDFREPSLNSEEFVDEKTFKGFDTPAPTEWQTNSWVEYDENGVARHYTSDRKYKIEDY